MAPAESEMKMRILLAAKKLFAKQGFDGTSVRQICEEAGANVALVSYYFGGKENVFRALLENFFPGQRMSEYEALLQDPVEGLRLLVTEVILFSMQDIELSTIVQQELEMRSPRTEIVASFTKPVWQKARELLERGREQGVFQFDSLDHAWMFVLGATLAPKKIVNYASLLTESKLDPEMTASQTVKYIFAAFRPAGTSA